MTFSGLDSYRLVVTGASRTALKVLKLSDREAARGGETVLRSSASRGAEERLLHLEAVAGYTL